MSCLILGEVYPSLGEYKLKFSLALRALLRQDPDIIMIGEIRDQETMEISIRAAQTGHLVLVTLHTNDAKESLTRLHNMGVAAFNIATSINLIIAQHLVRRLCLHCRIPDKPDQATLLQQGFKLDELNKLQLYQAHGCKKCTAGYQGRIAIFELLPMTTKLRNMILKQQNSSLIISKTIKNGATNLRHAA